MGLLDNLLGAAGAAQAGGSGSSPLGGLADMVMKNPQALSAIASLLSGKDGSVGGAGGLGGLVSAFQSKGLGDMINSWISTGPNPPVSASQITDVLGHDTVAQFATKAGVSHGDAGGLLASLLPQVIDHLTPQGNMPAADSLESALGGLLSGFGR
jgi:uncharacterized protein YidB (DUF937 family)